MEEFLVEAESETLVAVSPYLGKCVVNRPRNFLLNLPSRKKRTKKKKKRTLMFILSKNVRHPLQVLPLKRRRLSGYRVGVVELCRLRMQKH